MRGGFFARYLAAADESTETGYLTYLRQTTLFAVPFHAGHLALAGAPAPILEDVSSTLGAGGDFAFAQSGPFVYFSQKTANSGWPISWIESRKNSQPTDLLPPGQYLGPRFSPDGKRLVFSVNNGRGADIWVKDLDRPTPSKLSFLPGLNSFPVWTPDGKYIVFRSTNPAAPGWSGVRSDGSSEAKSLTDGNGSEVPSSFSPDGKRLAAYYTGDNGSYDIFTLPVQSIRDRVRWGSGSVSRSCS